MSKLAFHSLILVSAKMISGLSSIACGVVLARMLTVEEYGTYSQLILIASTLVLFSNLSLPRSLYYFIPKAAREKEKKNVAFQITAITLLTSLVFSLALFFLSHPLSIWMNNKVIDDSIVYCMVYLFFLSTSSLFEPFLISLKKADLVSIIELFTGIGLLIAILFPLLRGMDYRNILFFMSAVLLIKVVTHMIILFRLKGQIQPRYLISGVTEKIKYSLPLAIDSMIGVIGRRIDQLIISLMFVPTEYALYARGAFELPLVSIIPMTIFNLMLPDFTDDLLNNKPERVIWQFGDKSRRVALLFFPLTILMLILAEAFIIFLFSKKYAASVPVFRVYLLLLPIRINMAGTIIKAAGRTSYFIWGNLFALASNVMLSLLFIKLFGMIGAALGTVISVILYLVYIMRINCKVLHTKINKLLPWRDLSLIMLTSILAGFTILPALSIVGSNFYKLILGTVLFSLCYFIFGYFFKIFQDSDILLVKRGIAEIRSKINL